MHRWKTSAGCWLILLAMTALSTPVLARDNETHWEYKERREYHAPRLTPTEARQTVEASQKRWRIGELYQKWDDDEIEFLASINTEAGPIATLSIDPQTGDILPYEVEQHRSKHQMSKTEIIQAVEAKLPYIKVGDRAWLGRHGRYWRIPLFWKGVLITSVRVDTQIGALIVGQLWGSDDD